MGFEALYMFELGIMIDNPNDIYDNLLICKPLCIGVLDLFVNLIPDNWLVYKC